MSENNTELGYKNHDPFFYNLNRNFQTLMEVVAISRRDLSKIEELYINIDTFYMFYSCYINNNKEVIEKKLKDLKEFAYSNDYNIMINSKKANKELFNRASVILHDSINIIPLIMQELHDHELFPQNSEKHVPNSYKAETLEEQQSLEGKELMDDD